MVPRPTLWDMLLPQAPHSTLPLAGASKPTDPGHSSLIDLHFNPRTRLSPWLPLLVTSAKTCLTVSACAEPGLTGGLTPGASKCTAVLLLVPHCPLLSDSISPGPQASQPLLLYSDAPSFPLSECQDLHVDPEPCLSGPPAPQGHYSRSPGLCVLYSSLKTRALPEQVRPMSPRAKPSTAGPW